MDAQERSSRFHQQASKQNKRIRSITSLSPAVSRQEFLDVGEALLSVETHHRSALSIPEALEHVAIWRLRQPRLPHSVASTAALAEILWTEQQGHNRSSPTELSHAYAAAVLRAINGLADPMQQHRTMAASVAILCDSIGIPSWLVDVRHQATHQALPSLPVLRLAAGTLLQVFQTVYWEPYRAYVEDTTERAKRLLRAYQNASTTVRPDETATPVSPSATAALQDAPTPAKKSAQMMTNSSNDSEEEDQTNWSDRLVPQLGSNTNRFAALVVPKRKKKREAEQSKPAQQTVQKRPKKKKESFAAKIAEERSAAAAAYVQADLPLDIAYTAALDFLRERRQQRPTDDVLLVQSLCRAWPGWLALLQQQQLDDRIQNLIKLAKVVPAGNKKIGRTEKQNSEIEAPSADDQQQQKRRTTIWRECTEWQPCAIGEPPVNYK